MHDEDDDVKKESPTNRSLLAAVGLDFGVEQRKPD